MTSYVASAGQTLSGIHAGPFNAPPPSRAVLGDSVTVQNGGTLINSSIDGYAGGVVQSGGIANAVTVDGGVFTVAAGATVNGTVLTHFDFTQSGYNYDGYALDVSGTANNVTVTDGNLGIEVGGVVNGIDINSRPGLVTGSNSAALNVFGTANNLTMEGGVAIVDAGGTLLRATVSGGTLSVLGAASGLVINSTGIVSVAAGTTVSGMILNAGGLSTVTGVATNSTVSGGTQVVASGGVDNATMINQGGTESVLGGGTSNNATVSGAHEVNAGTVSGLSLSANSIFTNTGLALQASGNVSAAVAVSGGATITNSGTILGTGFGLFGDGAAPVTVTNSGTIQASNAAGIAIDLLGGGAITNSGTITGGSTGQAITGVSHLTLVPGQAITGGVQGASGSTLELTGLIGPGGTLSGLGSQYTGFATVGVDRARTWTLAGPSTLANGATLALGANSTLVATGALTDTGSGTIAFLGDAVLSLTASTTGLTVTGLAALDRINLTNIAFSALDTVTKVGNVVTITDAAGNADAITIAGAASENFALNSVAGGATELTVKPVIASLVAHPDATGMLGAGSVITFDLTPNVPLIINTTQGVPSLSLSDGGTATFDGTASSAGTLVFRTTVVGGQNTTDLKVGGISFGNATLVDQYNSPLDLTSVAPLAGSDTGIAILTTPPSVVDTTAPNAPANLALDPGSDSGVAGDGITNVGTVTLTGSAEAGSTVRIYDGTTAVGAGTASGTGLFSIAATLSGGGNTLTATATDAAGNVSGVSAALEVTLDTTLPTASAISAMPSAAGALGTGATVTFTLTPSLAVSLDLTQGSPTLTLNDGGTATYVATASTGTALVFQDTVLAGQSSGDLVVTGLVLNGSTITDAAGNRLDVSTVTPLSGSNTGLVVDTTPATPPAMGVTTMPGAKGGTVFTTVANASNSVTATATGSDVVNSLGSDTVQAGGGFDIVYASGPTATVLGGAGNLVFVAGAGNYTAGGGAGVDILYGGLGNNMLTGGKAAGSILVAGVGNVTLSGGAGSAALMYGSPGDSVFKGSVNGSDTMVGGVGGNTFNMTDGDIAFGGVAGPDVFNTGSGTSLIVEGQGATTINLGTGTTTDFASFNGSDNYVVTKGQDGSANIIGFKVNDHITLGGGFTAADASSAVSTATTGSFGTTLNLSDGTKVNLFGVSITASQVGIG